MPAGPYRVSSNRYPWRGPGIKKPKANKGPRHTPKKRRKK